MATARRPAETRAVYQQLREDFPQKACSWVLDKDVRWMPLRRVPLALIDYTNADSWDAETHKVKISRFRDKLKAGDDKPVILVMRPGKKTAMVADGHHRSIAARDEGKPPRAYLCIVQSVHGPWDEMHAAQRGRQGQVKLATPAPAPPQPGQVQSPPSQAQQDAQLALAVAVVLATATVPEAVLAALGGAFLAAGIRLEAAHAAALVVMAMPHDRQGMIGPATRNVIRLNTVRRAQFLIASARRITSDITQAVSHNESVLDAVRAAISRERRFYGQHMEATWNRMNAAARTDSMAMELGSLLLGWRAVIDARTSPECRAANGRNFRADIMPSIGYPGMVHPHCRCYPGFPTLGAKMLP